MVSEKGLLSIDGLRDREHFLMVMDRLCGQDWAFEYSPRETSRLQRISQYFPAGIQLHVWAGPLHEGTVHQPTEGATQPLWRVKSWVPGLNRAESLVGKTGTVITMDSNPSFPIFEVHGTESGIDWGPIMQCGEAAHARGQWTVSAVEYTVQDSPVSAFSLVPFALLLSPVEVAEVK